MKTAPWGDVPAQEATAALPPLWHQPCAERAHHTGRPPPPGPITVSLIPKTAEELQQLHEHTGLTWTDIVNRAISLYQFIEAQLAAGKHLLIRDETTGETQVVTIR